MVERAVEKVARVFRSFEEADRGDEEARRSMTPAQRVEIFFELQRRAYPDAANRRLARVCRVVKLEQT